MHKYTFNAQGTTAWQKILQTDGVASQSAPRNSDLILPEKLAENHI